MLPLIQHHHIEKCGGTTLQHFFLRAFRRDASLWMDRICDSPRRIRARYLKAANGDEDEANRKLSISIRFGRSFVRRCMLEASFTREVQLRQRTGRVVYVHNPYHDRCVIRSRDMRSLVVVRNPLERYVSHLKHVERYSSDDLRHARPIDRAIFQQVSQLSFDELAFSRRSLLPIKSFYTTYPPVIAAVNRSKVIPFYRNLAEGTVAEVCLPIESLHEFLANVCRLENLAPELATARSNVAQEASRFGYVPEDALCARHRNAIVNSPDYRVWRIAQASSRVMEGFFGHKRNPI